MENFKTLEIIIIGGIIIGFGILESFTGLYGRNSVRTKNDWLNEIVSLFQLALLIKPVILFHIITKRYHTSLFGHYS